MIEEIKQAAKEILSEIWKDSERINGMLSDNAVGVLSEIITTERR